MRLAVIASSELFINVYYTALGSPRLARGAIFSDRSFYNSSNPPRRRISLPSSLRPNPSPAQPFPHAAAKL